MIDHAIFIRNDKGETIKIVGAITDVTEKKKLELELQESKRREQINITATALAAQEKERNSIALELHDNVNQILVATKMILSCAKQEALSSGEYIESSIINIESAINETRKLAHDLATPDFDEIELLPMIESLMDSMLKKSGMEAHLCINNFNDCLLDSEFRLSAYRIVQEQFTNIVKYSRARMVNISLATASGQFSMIIEDDGIGITGNKSNKGLGLSNIKSRANVLGGIASIVSTAGKGFKLEISVPLGQPV